MWSPTHIQVTVQRAKGLLTKGKNGTNNCFVTISLGKEKYQTSVKDKAEANVSWNEECELKIPDQGNRAELALTCLHRNNLGIDEFLGQATLPLNEMDVYDRPRSKWFKLESKPGKEKKNKERGELEVRISFVVKSGSLTDLSKKEKHKSSIGQLASSVGGSLLSIGTIEKRKGIKKFAKSIGSKMHLSSKKKNKDGDDVSNFSGSFASIGTPNSSNGGSNRYGQRAGEADPGVISEDEDEFVFDNLSHKSSASSLNIRSNLQPPTQNFTPRNPSPLLGKVGGKPLSRRDLVEEDLAVDPELEELENDFSVRARTLPPPSKPPRTQQQLNDVIAASPKQKEPALDEWESKLYKQHLQIGSSDSLKRRSWEQSRVPLPTPNEEAEKELQIKVEEKNVAENKQENGIQKQENGFADRNISQRNSESDSSLSSSDSDEEKSMPELNKTEVKGVTNKPQELILTPKPVAATQNISLLSPDDETKDFKEFNASFSKFEQRNKSHLFDLDMDKKWHTQSFIQEESRAPAVPKAMPRNREREVELKRAEEEQEAERERQAEAEANAAAAKAAADAEAKVAAVAAAEAARKRQAELEAASIAAEIERNRREAVEKEEQRRAAEAAHLEEELRRNEQKLREEEEALQEELRQREEEKRREAKRREEDQRILNFAKRSTSLEEEKTPYGTPEQSPSETSSEKRERRMGKYKYLNKREKSEDNRSTPSPKATERIIIGHEKSTSHAERRSEISAALAKKYDGKSREELMLIANGMENEALLQRQRVKELEDYLDNLLLRVMETHPKLLQNPYSRTTSAKSG
ncbi:rab11 family-interacting protein 1 [Anastrepha obliqua]|uniref:rab11 family-interacting protein 1 n=1 Tax=Anastrepha obliqua TaxID=95512 RepID=UPI00240A0DD7|nr:rab11 family-interacting protein 1 [Anastrepha obliqua]